MTRDVFGDGEKKVQRAEIFLGYRNKNSCDDMTTVAVYIERNGEDFLISGDTRLPRELSIALESMLIEGDAHIKSGRFVSEKYGDTKNFEWEVLDA